jgi:DNA-binding transcriptional MerR regulator
MLLVATYRTIDLARVAGVHPNTVRLYEKIGFISPAPRASNGYRLYGEKHLYQIRICRCIFDHAWLGKELRRASLLIIKSMLIWDLQDADRHTQHYLALIHKEMSAAKQTARILYKWAQGCKPTDTGKAYSRSQIAEMIGTTEEAVRNWERNALIRVPRIGPNRTRIYGEAELERLRVIRMLRQSGYSMSAIHSSLRQYDAGHSLGIIEALSTHETAEGTSWIWVGDRWLESLEAARRGAETIVSLLAKTIEKNP